MLIRVFQQIPNKYIAPRFLYIFFRVCGFLGIHGGSVNGDKWLTTFCFGPVSIMSL